MKSEANILSGSVFTEDMYEAAVKRATSHYAELLRKQWHGAELSSRGLFSVHGVLVPRRIRQFARRTYRRKMAVMPRTLEKMIAERVREVARARVGSLVVEVDGTYFPASDVLGWLGRNVEIKGSLGVCVTFGSEAVHANALDGTWLHVGKVSGFSKMMFEDTLRHVGLKGRFITPLGTPQRDIHYFIRSALIDKLHGEGKEVGGPSRFDRFNDVPFSVGAERAIEEAQEPLALVYKIASENKFGAKPAFPAQTYLNRYARPVLRRIRATKLELARRAEKSAEIKEQEDALAEQNTQAGVGLGIGLGIGILLVFGLLSVVAG
jgi:hypothetical protein